MKFSDCDLVEGLSNDSNLLNWDLNNSRKTSEYKGVYKVKGNNVCYLDMDDRVRSFLANDTTAYAYLHVINENMTEYVLPIEFVSRTVFDTH